MPKNKKDPNKPKGCKSAYIFFTEHRREEMQKNDQAHLDFGPFSQECSALWRDMSEDERMPFILSANRDRDRHKQEMSQYIPPERDSDDDDSDEEGTGPRQRKKRRKKDPNAPKRNLSAYFFFAAENRASIIEDLTRLNNGEGPRCTEVMKVVGQRWSQVTDKTKYEGQAAKDRVRYQNQLAQFNKTGHFDGAPPRQSPPQQQASSESHRQPAPTQHQPVHYQPQQHAPQHHVAQHHAPQPQHHAPQYQQHQEQQQRVATDNHHHVADPMHHYQHQNQQ